VIHGRAVLCGFVNDDAIEILEMTEIIEIMEVS
jgi:hypothetical protein